MKLLFFSLFFISILSLNGYAGESSATAEGKTLYYETYGCNTCHRIGNDGGGVVVPDLVGPDLTFIGYRKTPQWLDLWLNNPSEWKPDTNMQNLFLDENKRRKLVDFLVSLNGEEYRKNPPWNKKVFLQDPIKRGGEIYELVGCGGCHGKEGVGGYPNNNVAGGKIPPLTFVSDGYTKKELKDRIRKGIKSEKANPKDAEPMLAMPAWSEVLREDELDALVDYLYSIRPAKTEEDVWGGEASKEVSQLPPSGNPVHGRNLFTGMARFKKRGPSCMACHNIAGIGLLGGGTWGPDLTGAFTKFGEKGIASILSDIPFLTMSLIFKEHPLTEEERADIRAFLQSAYKQTPESAEAAVEATVTKGAPPRYVPTLVIGIIVVILLTLLSLKAGTKKAEVRP